MTDPYRHHPELRGQITDPDTSFFREMTKEKIIAMIREMGREPPDFYSDEIREALRRDMLANAPPGDLWVFGYGSLMWDPAFHFAEVRRARIEGYTRRFILVEHHARGNEHCPSAMAALDEGPECHGLVFRIAEDLIERETEVLCRREMIGPGYLTKFHPAETSHGTVQALILVADPAAEIMQMDLPREIQIEYLANGCGLLGSSADYIRGIVSKFQVLGIEDHETEALLQDVEARIAAAN